MTSLFHEVLLDLLPTQKDPQIRVIDANIRDGIDGPSLLGVAALMGHPEVVRVLLDHGVDVNDASPSGFTPLQRAGNSGRVELLAALIDLLLSDVADIDAPTGEGFTSHHLASCRPDCGDVTAILLRYGEVKYPRWRDTNWSPLFIGAEYGNVVTTGAPLAAGTVVNLRFCEPGSGEKTPLDIATRSGQVEPFREFSRHGVDLDASCEETDCTTLTHAARKDHAGAVDDLIEAGASITTAALDCATYPLPLRP